MKEIKRDYLKVLSKTWHGKREKYDKKCLISSAHQGRFTTR
jgi:hypothetical protein